MTDLLDINVWLALVDARHTHHSAAARYWRDDAADQLAFCRVTMLGFMRLSTDARVMPDPLTIEEAWATYRRFLALPIIRVLPEPTQLEQHFSAFTTSATFRHRRWTDAYLAAFALASGCRLVSFDADFQTFANLNFLLLAP